MNGERRVRFEEGPTDGLFERSESRRVVNANRIHDRRKRPAPKGLVLSIANEGIKGFCDWKIYDFGF